MDVRAARHLQRRRLHLRDRRCRRRGGHGRRDPQVLLRSGVRARAGEFGSIVRGPRAGGVGEGGAFSVVLGCGAEVRALVVDRSRGCVGGGGGGGLAIAGAGDAEC